MATTIVRSHNSIRDQFGANPNSNPNPRTKNRCRRQKRNPTTGKPNRGLVMGQVKILKRGEELKPMMFDNIKIKSDLCSTDRLGPDLETVQKHVRVPDLYAAIAPPPPSCLPFPSAFVCRNLMETDLRRLLKI